MAGAFGHERENLALSRKIFDLSWREHFAKGESQKSAPRGFHAVVKSSVMLEPGRCIRHKRCSGLSGSAVHGFFPS